MTTFYVKDNAQLQKGKSRFDKLICELNAGKVKKPSATTIDLGLLTETYSIQYRDEFSHQERLSFLPKTDKYSVIIQGNLFDLLSKDHRLLWYLNPKGDIRLFQNTMEKLAHQAAPFLEISFDDCCVLVKELVAVFAKSQQFIENYLEQNEFNKKRSINYFDSKVAPIQQLLFWIVLIQIDKDNELKELFLLLLSKILPELDVLLFEVFEDKLVFDCLIECLESEKTSNEMFEYLLQKQSFT
ncbi:MULTISPECIES: hypothetical protein [Flavobacterium]|uniref:Uncharacterized protein n=2 Tax=Flavobacterium TaxID=237 RepID=A0ABP7UUC5_9FLAO